VIVYISTLSVLIVGVAEEVVVPTRFVIRLFVSVFVEEIVGTATPSTANTPAEERDKVVSEAFPSSSEPTPSAVLVDDVMPATGRPVQFVRVPEEGTPSAGVVSVGEVSVLLVNVSLPAKVAKVPVVGRVTLVDAVVVRVNALAPAVVKDEAVLILPPKVIVLEPLLTPVPPRVPESVPVHPTVIEEACKRAVAGVPLRVKVTFVSSTLVSAAGVIAVEDTISNSPVVLLYAGTFPLSVEESTLMPEMF